MPRYVTTLYSQTVLRLSRRLKITDLTFEPADDGIHIIKTVEADTIEAAESDVGSWARTLSEAISLVTRRPVKFRIHRTVRISVPGGVSIQARGHVPAIIPPLELPIREDEITKAVRMVSEIKVHSSDEDPVRRALSWYVRGVEDSDYTDKFVDHWIALETLSALHKGPVDRQKCPHCGKMTNPPVRSMIEALLRDFQVRTQRNLVRTLYGIRVRLFHSARATAQAKAIQPLLTGVLQECLVKCLQTSAKS